MGKSIQISRGPWLISFGVGLLCIPLGIFLAMACALIIVIGPIAGLLGFMTIEDTKK